MFDARERSLQTITAFKSITGIHRLRFTSSAEIENNLALERPPVSHNAASSITHFAIADQLSSRVATAVNAHCTVDDFNVKFCESRCKVCTIPYRIHDITCTNTMSWNCDCSAVFGYRELYISLQRQDYKNSILAWGNNGIPQTVVTFAYTINPFGLSAGCVFIKRSALQSVIHYFEVLYTCACADLSD